MTSKIIPVKPFDYVLFGGTGDLAERKLLPALYHRDHDGQVPKEARFVAISRSKLSTKDYRKFAHDALKARVEEDQRDDESLQRFLDRLHYIPLDAMAEKGWDELKDYLNKDDDEERIRAYYLAVSPSLFGPIAEKLESYGLVDDRARLVIEKPIGFDLGSAKKLNEDVGKHFREDQVFRIDHFLGKETVQNLLALRFANALFEPLWNSAHIDHVQITVAETVGLEDRAAYYDKSGALRDMVQNHLMQLLCLVAMEPPASGDADAIRDEKLKVLRSLKPITEESAEAQTVRAQYRGGVGPEGKVPGYLEELGEESDTATFVALKAEVENWRWAGVPFYMRTGKRMAMRMSEIVIQFKPVPHAIFGENAGRPASNKLVLRLQPDESVRQWIMIKDPGPGGMRLKEIALDMSFADTFEGHQPDAYERLLLDVIRGNQTLFMRRDEVEAAWRWIDPILEAWESKNQTVRHYTAGTWGPSQSIALIERDGRTWNDGDE